MHWKCSFLFNLWLPSIPTSSSYFSITKVWKTLYILQHSNFLYCSHVYTCVSYLTMSPIPRTFLAWPHSISCSHRSTVALLPTVPFYPWMPKNSLACFWETSFVRQEVRHEQQEAALSAELSNSRLTPPSYLPNTPPISTPKWSGDRKNPPLADWRDFPHSGTCATSRYHVLR